MPTWGPYKCRWGVTNAAGLHRALAEEDLVERVVGKSSRAVARIIAAVDPEVAVPRDTLRPLGEDRYTLKCTIDEQCQRGLAQLKGLLSHLDPALSWGTVVARLVQDGIRAL